MQLKGEIWIECRKIKEAWSRYGSDDSDEDGNELKPRRQRNTRRGKRQLEGNVEFVVPPLTNVLTTGIALTTRRYRVPVFLPSWKMTKHLRTEMSLNSQRIPCQTHIALPKVV